MPAGVHASCTNVDLWCELALSFVNDSKKKKILVYIKQWDVHQKLCIHLLHSMAVWCTTKNYFKQFAERDEDTYN